MACVEGAVADLVLVRFLDDKVSHGDAVAAVAARNRVNDGVGAGVVHGEGLVGELRGVGGSGIERVFVDGVAGDDLAVDVEDDDAVAALDGLHLQGEVTLGGVDGVDGHTRDRVGDRDLGFREGEREGAAVHGVGDFGGFLVEARRHRVGVAVGRIDGELKVGDGVDFHTVNGLFARELVVAVAVQLLAGNAVVLTVVIPAIAGHVVLPSLAFREGAVADLVLVGRIDNEDAGGDAVAAVAARHRVGNRVGSGFAHREGLPRQHCGIVLVVVGAAVETDVASVGVSISMAGRHPIGTVAVVVKGLVAATGSVRVAERGRAAAVV